jgi:hypothetical protein
MLHSCRFATASVLVAEIGSLPTVLLISKVGPGMTIQREGSKRNLSGGIGAPERDKTHCSPRILLND